MTSNARPKKPTLKRACTLPPAPEIVDASSDEEAGETAKHPGREKDVQKYPVQNPLCIVPNLKPLQLMYCIEFLYDLWVNQIIFIHIRYVTYICKVTPAQVLADFQIDRTVSEPHVANAVGEPQEWFGKVAI